MGAAGAAVGLGLQAVGTAGTLFSGGGRASEYASGITKREVELITHKWEKYDKRLLENEAQIRQQMLEQTLGEGGFSDAIYEKEAAQLRGIRDTALADLDYQIAQADAELERRSREILNQQVVEAKTADLAAQELLVQAELTNNRKELLSNQVSLLLGDIDRQGVLDEFAIARGAGEREVALDKQGFQQRYEVGDARRRVQDIAFSGEFEREAAGANVEAAEQGRGFSKEYAAGSAQSAITAAKAARDTGIAQAEASRGNRLNQLINQWAETEEDAARLQMALGTASTHTADAQLGRMLEKATTVTNQTVEDAQFQSALAAATGEFGVAQAGIRAADIRGQADIQSLDQLIGAQRGLLRAGTQEDIGNVRAGGQLNEAEGFLAMGDNERGFLRMLGGQGDTIASEAGRLGRESQRQGALFDAAGQYDALQAQSEAQQIAAQRGELGLSPAARYMQDFMLRDISSSRTMTDLFAPYVGNEIRSQTDRNLNAAGAVRDANRGSFDIRTQLNALNSRAQLAQAETNLAQQLLSGQSGGGRGGGSSLTQIANALGGLSKGAISLFNQPSPAARPGFGTSSILSGYSDLIPGFTGNTAQLPSFGNSGGFSGGTAQLPSFSPGNVVNPSLFTNAPANSFQIDPSVQFQGFGNF